MGKWSFLLLILAPNSHAAEFWSESNVTNTAIIAANVLIVADWAQTRYIATNPRNACKRSLIVVDANQIDNMGCRDGGYIENGIARNFIGENPTTNDVNRYFASSILITNLTGYFLPEKWKRYFYITIATNEAYYVYENNKIGIRGEF